MTAIESVSVAIQVLFENMRDPDAGIIRLGIRDNDKTRQAIATLINCTGSIIAEIEQLRQERDGLRDLIIKTMNSYVKEMEGYSYFGSNPGIDDDDIEEIADEIIAAMAKEQGE